VQGRPEAGRSLADEIAATLSEEIMSGRLRPRDRMIETELADRFGVSRAPVREALRLLESEGLVARGTQGMLVTELSASEAFDIFEILGHLEEMYTARATPQIGADDLDLLARLLGQMEAAAAAGDITLYYDLNTKFHGVIRDACPNRPLVALIESLARKTLRFRRLAMSLPGRVGDSIHEHRRICAAIAARDPAAAGRAARESAVRAYEALAHVLRLSETV
jgi:DNA-binding GntR family transcriptional regulator